MRVGGQRHVPTAILPGKNRYPFYIGCRVGPRAGLDGCVKLAPTGIPSQDGRARSESLYRLSYRSPYTERDVIDSYIFTSTCWFFSHTETSVSVHEMFKIAWKSFLRLSHKILPRCADVNRQVSTTQHLSHFLHHSCCICHFAFNHDKVNLI
jgi:hypothetical protein